jgi:hypothetical protein
VAIAVGAVFASLGGLAATYGWNSWTGESHKASMVRAVAAEWLANVSVINDPKIAETDDALLSKFVMFPRLQTTALEGAVSSGLFLREADRLFLTRASNLIELARSFNRGLDFTEQWTASHPNDIKKFRFKLRNGATRHQVADKLARFGKLLMSDYGVRESNQFFVDLEEDK